MARQHIPAALRRRVIARAKRRCEYCQLPDAYVTVEFLRFNHETRLRQRRLLIAANVYNL